MLKVLIAEDNVILGDMLEEFLTIRGYEVCGIARTVKEAVLLADLHRPDLAVLDFRLAEGEFGSDIRPLLEDKVSMGILYVSGDPLGRILTKADGEAYIQKPYVLADLTHALETIRQIKTVGYPLSTTFPRNFHLLEEAGHHHRRPV